MNPLRLFAPALLALVVSGAAAGRALADDDVPPTLEEVHHVLQQAAGDPSQDPPTADQQRDLLGQAIKMIRQIPHVYHGELVRATRLLEAALGDLSTGDQDHQVRHDILDADDLIRSLINS